MYGIKRLPFCYKKYTTFFFIQRTLTTESYKHTRARDMFWLIKQLFFNLLHERLNCFSFSFQIIGNQLKNI